MRSDSPTSQRMSSPSTQYGMHLCRTCAYVLPTWQPYPPRITTSRIDPLFPHVLAWRCISAVTKLHPQSQWHIWTTFLLKIFWVWAVQRRIPWEWDGKNFIENHSGHTCGTRSRSTLGMGKERLQDLETIVGSESSNGTVQNTYIGSWINRI